MIFLFFFCYIWIARPNDFACEINSIRDDVELDDVRQCMAAMIVHAVRGRHTLDSWNMRTVYVAFFASSFFVLFLKVYVYAIHWHVRASVWYCENRHFTKYNLYFMRSNQNGFFFSVLNKWTDMRKRSYSYEFYLMLLKTELVFLKIAKRHFWKNFNWKFDWSCFIYQKYYLVIESYIYIDLLTLKIW